jgi:tetratricopeptide (TPR) repeat protein
MNRFIIRSGALALVLKTLIGVCLTAVFTFGANSDAQAALDRAKAAYDQGNIQEAIKQYTQAIKADLNDANVYTSRGLAYASLGDYGKAIADYSQAIKLNPNDEAAYFIRGSTYEFFLGDYSKAIADYSQAIKLSPNHAIAVIAYGFRGNAYENMGDLKSATKDARKACELGDCDLLQTMAKAGKLRD